MSSSPELGSGVHQRGCDLEGVEGSDPKHLPLGIMTEEQLKGFLADAKGNTKLQEQLKAAADADAVAFITREAGFSISADGLNKAQSEISDEELERAVGGRRLSPAFCTLGQSPAINSCLDGALKKW